MIAFHSQNIIQHKYKVSLTNNLFDSYLTLDF